MIANPRGMARRTPDHCVLKHDAMRANLNRAALGYETRPKHNPAMRADENVAAHGRCWRNISRWVNRWVLSAVAKNHDGSPNDVSAMAVFMTTICAGV